MARLFVFAKEAKRPIGANEHGEGKACLLIQGSQGINCLEPVMDKVRGKRLVVLFYYLKFSRPFLGKFMFPLIPYSFQFSNIQPMDLVHIPIIWLARLLYLDRPASDDIERPTVG